MTLRPLADMNIVPYVDVMLVLLVVLLITSPVMMQGVDVTLPSAPATALPEQAVPPLVVSVSSQGACFLNTADEPSKPLSRNALVTHVVAQLRLHAGRAVLVQGDAHAAYEHVVRVMGWLQQAGVSHVGLVTDPQGSQEG